MRRRKLECAGFKLSGCALPSKRTRITCSLNDLVISGARTRHDIVLEGVTRPRLVRLPRPIGPFGAGSIPPRAEFHRVNSQVCDCRSRTTLRGTENASSLIICTLCACDELIAAQRAPYASINSRIFPKSTGLAWTFQMPKSDALSAIEAVRPPLMSIMGVSYPSARICSASSRPVIRGI